jgi:RNA polymerase sigma-70 factor, ECF subfamily
VIVPDERNLIAAWKRNDRSAINTIFLKYHALLCRVSFRIVNDPEEAKDVVQEVFIKLWKNRADLDISYSLETYLKKAVVNTSLNHIESKKKFIFLDPVEPAFEHAVGNAVDQQQIFDELSSRADHAIKILPIRTKAVFSLIRFEEMSYKEVAEILDISLKAVEKEMMKALKILREALKDYLPLLVLPLLGVG